MDMDTDTDNDNATDNGYKGMFQGPHRGARFIRELGA